MSVVSSSELVTPESDTVLLFADDNNNNNNNNNNKKVNYSTQKFVSMVRTLYLEQANNYW